MKRRFRVADRQRAYAIRIAETKDREIFVARSAIGVTEHPLESVRLHHSLKAMLLG